MNYMYLKIPKIKNNNSNSSTVLFCKVKIFNVKY